MSSKFHNKWHRFNHHTNPKSDPRYPDSSYDPIASPESPFQGAFVLNGPLSANSSLSGFAASFASLSTALILDSDNYALSARGDLNIIGDTTQVGNHNYTGDTTQVGNLTYFGNTVQVGNTIQTGDVDIIGNLSAVNVTVFGNLTALGDITYIDTQIIATSSAIITNNGTGPALLVNQTGAQPIANFQDDGASILFMADGGNIGLGVTNPALRLTVRGGISATNTIHSSAVATSGIWTTYIQTSTALANNVNIGTAIPTGSLTVRGPISGFNIRTSFNAGSAAGDFSFAEGSGVAFGQYTHAEGFQTLARGNFSHAAGEYAEAAHSETWIWHGSNLTTPVSTTRAQQFMVSAAGGVYFPGNVGIGTDSIANALTVRGNVSATNTLFTSAVATSGIWTTYIQSSSIRANTINSGAIALSALTTTLNAQLTTFANPVTASGEFLLLNINGTTRAVQLWNF